MSEVHDRLNMSEVHDRLEPSLIASTEALNMPSFLYNSLGPCLTQ